MEPKPLHFKAEQCKYYLRCCIIILAALRTHEGAKIEQGGVKPCKEQGYDILGCIVVHINISLSQH